MFVDFNILNQLGSPSINSNTFANRPAAGQTGRLFVSTDTFEIYRDNGTGWDLIGGPGAGTITGTGTATQVAYFTGAQTIGSSANLFWDATNSRLGIATATPGSRLDVHAPGTVGQFIAEFNATNAIGNTFLQFKYQGTNTWRIGNTYNGGNNFYSLHNSALNLSAVSFLAATNIAAFTAQQTYATGQAQSGLFTYNLTVPNGTNFSSPNVIGAVNSFLNLSFGGNTTVPASTRQGLEGNSRISFTGAGTLTVGQGSTVRAFSAISSVYSFNGSAVGTVTHLAGLRICFPDNIGSAINITNNYGLLLNDQTAGLGTVTYTNRWGIYQEGASDLNYFNGNLLLGSTTNSGQRLQVTGTALFTGAVTGTGNSSTYTVTAASGVARSKSITSTLVASANNDVLVGMDINPTFTIGAFTSVTSADLRTRANIFIGNGTVRGSAAYINYQSGGSEERGYYIGVATNVGSFTWAATDGITKIKSAYNAGTNAITFDGNTNNIRFHNNTATIIGQTFGSSGNWFIGSSPTDAGFRLDVNGTARVTSTLSTIGQNIAQGIFFWNEGALGGTADGTTFSTFNQANAKCLWFRGDPRFHNLSTPQSVYYFGARYSGVAGTYTLFNYMTLGMASTETFGISSGTSTANVINIILPYNYTGGTTTLRGIYYNPSLTSMTGVTHRAIETATGDVILGSTSGSTSVGATTTINASAQLQVVSTTKGFLPPVMTGAQAEAIATPAAGLMVYANNGNGVTITTTGWWGYDGATWVKLN